MQLYLCVYAAQEVPQESREVPPVRSKGDGRLRRNVVTERYIETAIVADRTMLEKHGRKNLESYLYSLMNVVRSSPASRQ